MLESSEVIEPSARATALVARCLVDVANPDDASRALSVGDREALLLHLRRATLGDVVDGVLRCPSASCNEPMELELRVSQLLLPPYGDTNREHDLVVRDDGARYDIRFRLPTGNDLDHASGTARHDPERAAGELLQRCLVNVSRDDVAVSGADLPPAVRDAISAAMAAKDPQAEIELELACPACGAEFAVVFDTATFFLAELDARASALLREVHVLAAHYHWSERDILRMPPGRRSLYLELVAESAKGRAR